MRSSAEPRANATLAIALAEGDSNSEDVPRVTATGRGAVAGQIIAIALDIDSPIPLGAPGTVTGIPTYVNRANGAPDRIANGAPDRIANGISEDSR